MTPVGSRLTRMSLSSNLQRSHSRCAAETSPLPRHVLMWGMDLVFSLRSSRQPRTKLCILLGHFWKRIFECLRRHTPCKQENKNRAERTPWLQLYLQNVNEQKNSFLLQEIVFGHVATHHSTPEQKDESFWTTTEWICHSFSRSPGPLADRSAGRDLPLNSMTVSSPDTIDSSQQKSVVTQPTGEKCGINFHERNYHIYPFVAKQFLQEMDTNRTKWTISKPEQA